MRQLDITKDAAKFLGDLAPKQYKQVCQKVLALLNDAAPPDSSILQGAMKDYRRADIGEYRIIYSFDTTVVAIALIAKRNDDAAYKEMKKRV